MDYEELCGLDHCCAVMMAGAIESWCCCFC